MSLLTQAMEDVVLMEKRRESDGEGGFLPAVWVDGASFNAAITFNSSLEAKVAEKQGATSLYSVICPINAKLEYHDVIRRLRDGKIFRITSDGDDEITTDSATFQFVKVSAEEWVPA